MTSDADSTKTEGVVSNTWLLWESRDSQLHAITKCSYSSPKCTGNLDKLEIYIIGKVIQRVCSCQIVAFCHCLEGFVSVFMESVLFLQNI